MNGNKIPVVVTTPWADALGEACSGRVAPFAILICWGSFAMLSSCGYPTPAPPPEKFDVQVTVNGTRKLTVSPRNSFRISSGQLNVGCGDSANTSVQWPIPAGATDIQPTASWQHTDNLKGQSQQTVINGGAVVATGGITGLDKQLFNCPGGGHGELVLEGSYQPANPEAGPEVVKTVHDQLAPGQDLIVQLPAEPALMPTSSDIRATGSKGAALHQVIRFAVDSQGKLAIGEATPANSGIKASLNNNILTVTVSSR